MSKQSAGILLFRLRNDQPEVLLVHPGGPFWAHKDEGAWTIPKGEPDGDEDLLQTAKREFREETGIDLKGELIPLTPVRQKSGKTVHAWMVEGNLDEMKIKSNEFEMEWPPKSGRMKRFPEIDKAVWFGIREASQKINPAQVMLLEELLVHISLRNKR